MSAPPVRNGITGLIKRGWVELPDIVFGSVLAIIGLGLSGIGLANYYRNDGDNRKYKIGWVIMRPDDPRAAKVHKD
ncbi:uncharacterized protein LOC129912352 [Episyrphus balteatus]|uniref:uncharacterized protein LOC129912352 n=1 Tax=Episyrphus balteatus TaxID=286459 RepID=UPI0024869239|nr:uncharacterized protein LOC129912352 [Episyrphus balteatus]